MGKSILAAILCSALLAGCCLLPQQRPVGISRDKVATEITKLVRGMRWKTLTGLKSCSDPDKNKELSPKWAQITVSMLEQYTTDINPSASTGSPISIVLPITPTLGLDLKKARATQTDSVIIVDKLRESATWPQLANHERQIEADELTKLVESAENDLVKGGDSDKPCLAVSNVAISTILDLTETVTGEVKIGFGPIVVADLKGSSAKESKATLKFEIHYAGDPPPGAQQLLEQILSEQQQFRQQLMQQMHLLQK
jgi:hypothetical protein